MSSHAAPAAAREAVEVSASAPAIRTGLLIALAIFGLVAPFLIYPLFLMKLLCFALFACAFNLLIGYAGLLSFGHATFFGGAAYVTGYAAKAWGLTPELAILVGVAAGAFLGLVVGFLAIRRQGIYFSMITLALGQMFYFLCLRAPFTGGEDGLQGIPRNKLFGLIDIHGDMTMYYVVFAIFLIGLAIIWRFIYSPFGMVLKAIRENEQRAISLGYSVNRAKLGAFVMSAALAGLAGGTKAIVFQFATLTDVGWQMSGEVILMTLLGGIGTVLGPILGSSLVVALENYLAATEFPVTIITGLVFMVCVLLFRRGILGEFYASRFGRRLGFEHR